MNAAGRTAVEFEGRINVAEDGKTFRCDYMREGPVNAGPRFGIEVIRRATILRDMQSFVGKPLIIEHVDPEKFDPATLPAHGRVNSVGFDVETGWFWCAGSVDTDEGRQAARERNPSCGYIVPKGAAGPAGRWNNIAFDRELTALDFHHLALCKARARYEEADFRLNAVTEIREGKTMNLFKLFRTQKPAEAGAAAVTTETEIPADTEITLASGVKVRLNSLAESFEANEKAAKDAADKKRLEDEANARLNALNDDTEVLVAGKKVTIGALKKAHADAETARVNEETAGKEAFARLNTAAVTGNVVRFSESANSAKDKSTRGNY